MDACGLSTTPVRTRLLATLAAAVLAALAFAAASSARGVALPNPCTILSSAHAQSLTAKASAAVSAGKLKTYGSGKSEQVTCDETVGTISVYLSYYLNVGGSGGVRIIKQSHPAGFGGTATLTVGTGAGNNAPVDYITFRKGALYADLSANGGQPSKLTTLGQEVYKLTP
jgi:N-methylhydantoinase B/oxoprolinase/acetone carboxylase alpha subunit